MKIYHWLGVLVCLSVSGYAGYQYVTQTFGRQEVSDISFHGAFLGPVLCYVIVHFALRSDA